MAKQQIIILLSLLLAVLCGCGNTGNQDKEKQDKQDKFYTVAGGWDWVRVPLLKPYAAKKVDPEVETSNWGVEFFNSLGTYNVKRVAVQDSVVYILSGQVDEKKDSTLVNLRNVPTGWYAIDVRTKTEKGFASEQEFKAYIKENNYPAPQWHDIDSLSKALSEGNQVPWIPK